MKEEIRTKGEINYGIPWLEDNPTFFLNHSCDEWIIGDLESAKKFRNDLDDMIKEIEAL